MVGKVRAGHWGWPSRPLQLFSLPPVIPRRGISRPPPHQAEAGAAPGHSSAPALSRPLHLPFRTRARASPALSAAPGTGTPLADPRAVFSFPGRRSSAFPLVVWRALVSLICSVGGQRCSRRGRAAASLPAGLVHRLPHRSPPPSLAGAIVRRGQASLRPSGRLASAPVRPVGAPSTPPGRA